MGVFFFFDQCAHPGHITFILLGEGTWLGLTTDPWGWSKPQQNPHFCVKATLMHVRITLALLTER